MPRQVENWARGIERWIRQVERHEKTPDLWDTLYRARDYAAGHDGSSESTPFTARHEENSENAPFTRAEQAQISDQMQQLKAFIKHNYKLSSKQMSHVEAKLDEVEEASRRIGRKDWIILFNGAVASLMLSDLIPALYPRSWHNTFSSWRFTA